MKQLALESLRASGVIALARRAHRRQLLVLTYHGVIPLAENQPLHLYRNVIEDSTFRRQMEFLRSGFECMSLGEAQRHLRLGLPLPDHAAAVTFDDGFANNLEFAAPILRSLGIPATIFLTTGHIGKGVQPLWTERIVLAITKTREAGITLPIGNHRRSWTWDDPAQRVRVATEILDSAKGLQGHARAELLAELDSALGDQTPTDGTHARRYRFLDWEEIRSVDPEWIEWGSHTVHHETLRTLDDRSLHREVAESKASIEAETGMPCRLFSYPNGSADDFGPRDQEALRRTGYECASTQISGFNGARQDLFALRRMNISRRHTDSVFEAMVSGAWHPIQRILGRHG